MENDSVSGTERLGIAQAQTNPTHLYLKRN